MKFANLKVNQNLQSDKHSFQLPDGAFLAIKHPQDKGSQSNWWRTYTKLVSKVKVGAPLLGGFSSKTNMHMVFVDFDFLPKGFNSWDELSEYCAENIPSVCVTKSFSNKTKLALIIKWMGKELIPNIDLLPHIINDILPECLRDTYDKRGMTTHYLNDVSANDLKNYLVNPAYYTVLEHTYSNIVLESDKNSEIINFYTNTDTLFSNDFVSNTAGWKDREKFLRVLGAMHNLLNKDGFGLSQRCLSSYLGVSQATVSMWIKRLIDLRLIKPVSNSYIVGIKAKHYIALGPLREWIVKNKNSCNYPKVLPQFHPVDGTYYQFLLSLSRRCMSWSEYKLALSHVNDIDKKGRLRMAYAIRRCDERKSRRTLDENKQVQRSTAEGNGRTL
jgi:hypothetical protein